MGKGERSGNRVEEGSRHARAGGVEPLGQSGVSQRGLKGSTVEAPDGGASYFSSMRPGLGRGSHDGIPPEQGPPECTPCGTSAPSLANPHRNAPKATHFSLSHPNDNSWTYAQQAGPRPAFQEAPIPPIGLFSSPTGSIRGVPADLGGL